MSRFIQPGLRVIREVGQEVGTRGAKQKIEDLKSGASRSCTRQATATSHFAKTGEKLEIGNAASAAGAAAPTASVPGAPSPAAQQAATQAIIRSRLQQAATPRGR